VWIVGLLHSTFLTLSCRWAGRVFKVLPSLLLQGRRVCPGTNLPGLRFSFEDSEQVADLLGRWCAVCMRGSNTGGVDFHLCPLIPQPTSSLGVAKVQSTWPRATAACLCVPLHRHQRSASAPTSSLASASGLSSDPLAPGALACRLTVEPLPRAAGQGLARLPAPSVPVVPPDFDGLLRASPCGLVASRSRPWGSSRFQTPTADREWDRGISPATRGASARVPFPGTHDPSKPFPCTQPSKR
jgi:hypothetical protein